MDKDIKILTVCNKGNCRSVGTRYCLYNRGYRNVIAIGGSNTSPKTLKMLCNWADKILLAKVKHISYLPDSAWEKVDKQFTIGEDTYKHSMNPELHKLVCKQLDLIGLK